MCIRDSNSSVYNYETKQYTQIYDYDKLKSLDKYDIYLSGASSIIDIVNPCLLYTSRCV